jgi:hypothetical protein
MQATAGKFNNQILNRVGITGFLVNIVEISEQGGNVVYFDVSFPQAAPAEDGVISCRADSPQIVTYARRIHEGYGIEVGGTLQQDSEGRLYLAAHYVNFQGGRK